jgi:hypothetical protein
LGGVGLKDLGIVKNITKVTTPIVYRDFGSILREKAVREKKKDKYEEMLKRADAFSRLEPCQKACTIGYFADALLSHCAQMIYVLDYGDLSEEVMAALPPYLKPRIKWVDSDRRLRKSVDEMLFPVFDELETIWSKKRKAGVEPTSLNGHEHGLCVVGEFIHTLAAAVNLGTEADADIDLTRRALRRIRTQVKSGESQALISRLEGIVNCYPISGKIPGMVLANEPAPDDLLKDLLDDAKIVSLSKSRYLLGIPGKFQIAMVKMRQGIRGILSDRSKRKYLAVATKLGNVATKHINIEIPDLDVDRRKVFAPPLISLHEAKPNCLKTLRELPKVKP